MLATSLSFALRSRLTPMSPTTQVHTSFSYMEPHLQSLISGDPSSLRRRT